MCNNVIDEKVQDKQFNAAIITYMVEIQLNIKPNRECSVPACTAISKSCKISGSKSFILKLIEGRLW